MHSLQMKTPDPATSLTPSSPCIFPQKEHFGLCLLTSPLFALASEDHGYGAATTFSFSFSFSFSFFVLVGGLIGVRMMSSIRPYSLAASEVRK